MRGAPASYYSGQSAHPIRGELRAAPDGILFAAEEPGPDVRFAYDRVAEAKDAGSHCRVVVFIDAAESHEFRFTDRELLARVIQGRRAQAGFARKAVYAVAAWPTFRKVLLGLFFLPLSVGAFLLAIGQAHLFVPRTVDRYLGDLAEPHLSAAFTFCDDPRLATALSEMAGRLAGNHTYSIRVVHESEVNALALPNGSIYLFSGLLAESQSAAEVAGVMAHEMAHVEERHATRQLIQVLGFSYLAAMVLGAGFEEFESAESLGELASLVIYFQYSRDFEREADLYAARMLRAARIDGRGMVDFFRRRLSPESVERDRQDPREILAEALPDFLRSHPHDRERMAAIAAELAAAADGPAGPASVEALTAETGWKSLRGRCSDINP